MVGFRGAVAGQAVTGWWDNGNGALSVSRGSKGFVAMNLEDAAVDIDRVTDLPEGRYCDVLTGGAQAGACIGREVTVEPGGRVRVSLGAGEAVAIHTGVRP